MAVNPPHLDLYRAARRERGRAVESYLGDVYEEPKPIQLKPARREPIDCTDWIVRKVFTILIVAGAFVVFVLALLLAVILHSGLFRPWWPL